MILSPRPSRSLRASARRRPSNRAVPPSCAYTGAPATMTTPRTSAATDRTTPSTSVPRFAGTQPDTQHAIFELVFHTARRQHRGERLGRREPLNGTVQDRVCRLLFDGGI